MTQIISFSLIIWILIDRAKKSWQNSKYKSYITTGIALALSLAVAFYYQLDLVVALDLASEKSIIGIIFAGIAMTGGSSCIAEIIEKISNPFDTDIKEG